MAAARNKSLMGTPKLDPAPSYNFTVFLDKLSIGFSKITNIEEAYETETIQEGGVNDRVYTVLKSTTSEKTLVFERSTVLAGKMGQGHNDLWLGNRIRKNILIEVHDRNGKTAKIFEAQGCVIKRISYSDLDAMSAQTLIERMEISYETLLCLQTMPS